MDGWIFWREGGWREEGYAQLGCYFRIYADMWDPWGRTGDAWVGG